MDNVFYTTNVEIEKLGIDLNISKDDFNSSEQKTSLKKKIRPLIKPNGGIIKGDVLKDIYFPSSSISGEKFDFFISHSHNDKDNAYILAAWLIKQGYSCFIDSIAWGSADEMLKEIDLIYCYRKHNKTYDYTKRNFTTSHVHAILSMALLETIKNSKYGFFIQSEESISLTNGLRKKTFSPWLYEEIKYMELFNAKRTTRLFSNSEKPLNESFNIEYDVDEIKDFKFVNFSMLKNMILCHNLNNINNL